MGDVTLLSGVVRNRKGVSMAAIPTKFQGESPHDTGSENCMPGSRAGQLWSILCARSAFLRNFKLRVHKFTFQWDLGLHFSIAIIALSPFLISGSRLFAIVPISVWVFYHVLFIVGSRRADQVVPNFSTVRETFRLSFEEFFSPKLLPILSISYLLVILSLSVTGRRLDGPPLCFSTCHVCLSKWGNAVAWDTNVPLDLNLIPGFGCGYTNGKELLAFYTMAQTSFLPFFFCIIAMAVCMGWRVADDEQVDRSGAEDWLKKEDMKAFIMREEIIKRFGRPGSSLRPEGSVVWVFCGTVSALTFTLLGWSNWQELAPSTTATLLIILNLLTILASIIMLHLGFFGRLLALYNRNKARVEYLTTILKEIKEDEVEVWWNCRNFVLNDDLALDYDIGGLAVSVSFILNCLLFVVVIVQSWKEGLNALLEPPGSYCGYACLYITMCLMKIFSFATETYEEQHRHISELMNLSSALNSNDWNSMTPLQTPTNASVNQNNNLVKPQIYNNAFSHVHDDDNLGLCYEDEEQFRSTSPISSVSSNNSHSHSSNNLSGPSEPFSGPSSNSFSNGLGLSITIPSANVGNPAQLSPRKINSALQVDSLNASEMSLTSSIIETDKNDREKGINSDISESNNSNSKKYTSNNQEYKRQTIADMMMQIRRYDPYPCILGIPIMPALFNSWKTYIFIISVLVGARCMVFSLRSVTSPNNLAAFELADRVNHM